MHFAFWGRCKPTLKLVTVAATLLATLRPAYGMEFSITHASPWSGNDSDINYLLLKGEIVPGDYSRLLEFAINKNVNLAQYPFILASPGGDVSEALKIGQLVKSLYATVVVGPATGQCVSACFIIFASAVDRIMNNDKMIGIHRPYVYPDRLRSLSPSAAEALETDALLEAEKYLHELRVPTSLVEEMFEQASTEVHWLTRREFLELGRRAPWYEEFLIARCGLDKSAEIRVLTNHASVEDQTREQAANRCEGALIRPEGARNFDCVIQRWQKGQSASKCK
jgi:hypothetical protein